MLELIFKSCVMVSTLSVNAIILTGVDTPKTQYDCTSRYFRDTVRANHDISATNHDQWTYNFYGNNEVEVVERTWKDLEELGLSKTSCGQKLIRISFDTTKTDTNSDMVIDVINWVDDPQDDPSTPKLEVYFSDIYFNASRLHYGMSKVQFRKLRYPDSKYPNGRHSIGIRFFGSLNWHYGNLTSMQPLNEDKSFVYP